MASASALAVITPAAAAIVQQRPLALSGSVQPTLAPARKPGCRSSRLEVRASASLKEKAASVANAAAMLAVPEVADAAGPGLSPSLKNFLLSIVAGGVVLAVIIGAVIGVANFDPVKRS